MGGRICSKSPTAYLPWVACYGKSPLFSENRIVLTRRKWIWAIDSATCHGSFYPRIGWCWDGVSRVNHHYRYVQNRPTLNRGTNLSRFGPAQRSGNIQELCEYHSNHGSIFGWCYWRLPCSSNRLAMVSTFTSCLACNEKISKPQTGPFQFNLP